MTVKQAIRSTLIFLGLDLTKNLEYDRLTEKIMKREIKPNHNCIDIGCHKGEILELMLKLAPNGKHFAFEPIPYLYENLKRSFDNKVTIYPYALAESNGQSTFQLVKNAPAYSGIKKRQYDIQNPEIEEIEVELMRLDELIPENLTIHFIKIDVEGAEYGVLKGAKELLKRDRPTLLFECGKGASDFYGTKPLDIHQFITADIGLNIYTLKSFIKAPVPLSKEDFEALFESNKEYYFVASAN